MEYEIFTTEQAVGDLRAIFEYIAYDLMSGQNAMGQLDRLEKAIESLKEYPERNRIYNSAQWENRNLRVMPVDNYLVFYIVETELKRVTVIRVMYGRRDTETQLKENTVYTAEKDDTKDKTTFRKRK